MHAWPWFFLFLSLTIAFPFLLLVTSLALQRHQEVQEEFPFPEYAIDARQCLKSRGFAFVPEFGKLFAGDFLFQMAAYKHKAAAPIKQSIAGGGAQIFMPGIEPPVQLQAIEKKQTSGQKRSQRSADAALTGAPARRRRDKAALKNKKAKDEAWQAQLAEAEAKLSNEAAPWTERLKAKWHELVKSLARYLGFSEEDIGRYHVQDEKVSDIHSFCLTSSCRLFA